MSIAQTVEDLRLKRRALDLTLEDVSGALGVSVTTVHRWERGSRRPHLSTLRRWQHYLEGKRREEARG